MPIGNWRCVLRSLRKRAGSDTSGIKHAEMEYFHALQHLYTAVQDAVAPQYWKKPLNPQPPISPYQGGRGLVIYPSHKAFYLPGAVRNRTYLIRDL